jgi:hypothetical protein
MKARYLVKHTSLTRLIAILPAIRESEVLATHQLDSLVRALELKNFDDSHSS